MFIAGRSNVVMKIRIVCCGKGKEVGVHCGKVKKGGEEECLCRHRFHAAVAMELKDFMTLM